MIVNKGIPMSISWTLATNCNTLSRVFTYTSVLPIKFAYISCSFMNKKVIVIMIGVTCIPVFWSAFRLSFRTTTFNFSFFFLKSLVGTIRAGKDIEMGWSEERRSIVPIKVCVTDSLVNEHLSNQCRTATTLYNSTTVPYT